MLDARNESKFLKERKCQIQALNTIETDDQRMIVILSNWQKIYGPRHKDSIFGQFLPVVFQYWKVYHLILFLLEKTKAELRQINNLALTNSPE